MNATLQNAQCAACGRDYRYHLDCGDTDLLDGMPCPSDDCPSHWEEQGVVVERIEDALRLAEGEARS